ncbi:MAG: helicase HerA-like domain-containing protein [Thermoplasmata archaeon]
MVEKIYSFFDLDRITKIPDGHGAIFGKTGSGKTSMLQYIAKKLSENGETVIVLDPHGDISKNLLTDRTIYISPLFLNIEGKKFAIKMNLMDTGEEKSEERIVAISESMKLIFSQDIDFSQGTWGPRLETIFSAVVPRVMRNVKNATLSDIANALLNKQFFTDNIFIKSFYGKSYMDYIQSTLNKIIPVTENIYLKEFLCSRDVSFSFLKNDINGKIVSIYLAKPELGEFISRMSGSALLAMISNAAAFGKIKNATLIIDEIKDFSPYLLPGMFSESRKYGLRIIIAAQYIKQLDSDLYNSIMGNVSWISAFRLSPDDAFSISKKFSYDNEKIERTIIDLPGMYALMKYESLKLIKIPSMERLSDEKIIEKSYLEIGSEIDFKNFNVLSIIYSLQERKKATYFSDILREYESIFNGDFKSLDASLRILQLNGLIIKRGNKFMITESGIENLIEKDSFEWETLYHRYLVTRTAEYFRALGFDVNFSRPWKEEPDLIAENKSSEFYIEAEYGDLKSPGKIINHLIQWRDKKIIFVTFPELGKKLFRILCMPAMVDEYGRITYYKNNGKSVDYRLAGDYSRRTWILLVPGPGELGSIMKFSCSGIKDLVFNDLIESDLFNVNGKNIIDLFGQDLFIIKNGKVIKRCDYVFNS